MDDKGSYRQKVEKYGRRRKQAKYDIRTIWKFLSTHKNTLGTSMLLILLVGLLFGVFSQFQSPVMSSTPNGVNVIDYSTFVQQVKADNVQAVVIQGNTINGLLARPPQNSGGSSTPATPGSTSADDAAWSRYIGPGGASGTLTGGTALPAVVSAGRAVSTIEPPGGDAQLLPLLQSNHITITTLPSSQSASWLALLWKFIPILALVILVIVFFSSRKGTRSARAIDERITQSGKSHARRFTRVKEGSAPETRKPTNTALTPTTATKSQAAGTTALLGIEPQVTFADVAGIDEVRVELEEIVQFLRTPERFNRLGARIPRGALLVGPPGTGKTLLAKAVAGEAEVPFFSISASEFVEMFVGVGASRVRDLFHQARQASPCVIFIDEIDAVGRKRTLRATSNDERDQTLNQLLVELDGFDSRRAVVVLAATNRVDILDKALLRPGRFDRNITVSMPTRPGREAILKVHTRNTPLHETVSLANLSRITTGMSGADLANLVNEAALTAARRDLEHVTHDCFEDALARVQLGALRPLVISEKERRIIAFHEGGHALVAHHLPEADTVNRVTILPRGQSLGVTQFTAEEDRYNYSRETLMARIAVGLGGRVAEELVFGSDKITTGAENDFQVVTDLARRMVTRWGMSKQVGVVFADHHAEAGYALNMQRIDPDSVPFQARSIVVDHNGGFQWHGGDPQPPQRQFAAASAPRSSGSAAFNAQIDAEVQLILNQGYAVARTLLTEHYDQLTLLANALMEHEQLDRKQFEALFNG